jgi:hypothetical protein
MLSIRPTILEITKKMSPHFASDEKKTGKLPKSVGLFSFGYEPPADEFLVLSLSEEKTEKEKKHKEAFNQLILPISKAISEKGALIQAKEKEIRQAEQTPQLMLERANLAHLQKEIDILEARRIQVEQSLPEIKNKRTELNSILKENAISENFARLPLRKQKEIINTVNRLNKEYQQLRDQQKKSLKKLFAERKKILAKHPSSNKLPLPRQPSKLKQEIRFRKNLMEQIQKNLRKSDVSIQEMRHGLKLLNQEMVIFIAEKTLLERQFQVKQYYIDFLKENLTVRDSHRMQNIIINEKANRQKAEEALEKAKQVLKMMHCGG